MGSQFDGLPVTSAAGEERKEGLKGEGVAGSSPEQAAVPPLKHGETEGAGRSSRDTLGTEDEESTRRKGDRVIGPAMTFKDNWPRKVETWGRGKQDERGSMGSITGGRVHEWGPAGATANSML